METRCNHKRPEECDREAVLRVHPCELLAGAVGDPSNHLTYWSKFREFGIYYTMSESKMTIAYCPFCGQLLPPSLRDRWVDEINALGFEPYDSDTMPERYRSSAWWEDAVGDGKLP